MQEKGLKAITNKIKVFLDGGPDEYEEYDERDEHEEDQDFSEDEEYEEPQVKRSSNVYQFSDAYGVTTSSSSNTSHPLSTIAIEKPAALEDCTYICNKLKSKIACIIDMQYAEPDMAQRIADYLSGIGYALNSNIERVDNFIFVMTPEHVKITQELKEDIKTGSFVKASFGR